MHNGAMKSVLLLRTAPAVERGRVLCFES